ncbi:MAG: ATP-dependent Clp protease ATP-binding subunit, partial [Myxococcales bacterium]|nr:ATP-dependent Clp protease ATP-binding subunit [Myxococcales bacterium]
MFLLEERGINEDVIIENMRGFQSEPESILGEIRKRAEMYAVHCCSGEVNGFHLLMALCRVQDAIAYRVMRRCGIDVASVRTQALSYVTGSPTRRADGSPRSTGNLPAPAQRPKVDRPRRDPSTNPRPEGDPHRSQPGTPASDAARDPRRQSGSAARAEAPRAAEHGLSARSVPVEELGRFELAKREYPLLTRLGRNLTMLAEEAGLDPLVGRERELDQMIDVLGKRRANNPCLVGDPGVGKTAIVEGLAVAIAKGKRLPQKLKNKVVIELDTGSLIAGTQLRGSFSEKLQALKNEVKKAEGRVIIFIDEIHTIIGAGASDGPLDAANELKSALARGEFPCIGATTFKEYKKYIEADPALERRFQPIVVDEPNREESLTILQGVVRQYETHHHVRYAPDALRSAVQLTHRYINDRCLPDKALHAIDLAGARVSRQARHVVTADDVASVVAEAAQIPVEKLKMSDADRLLKMESYLGQVVIGHGEVISRVSSVIRRNYAGFGSHRPIGSFLFVGPTGVGKTELVKALADFLFQSRDAMVRFDMSEYMEPHSISRLVGAPPGYVGHDDGGQLTDALHKKPYQVVLFDEIEKASREILNLLLQLLDEGRITDAKGKRVDFSNTIVVLTTNLGSDVLLSTRGGFGFGAEQDGADLELRALADVRRNFTPDLCNRNDEKLVCRALTRNEIHEIDRLQMRESSCTLKREKQIAFE